MGTGGGGDWEGWRRGVGQEGREASKKRGGGSLPEGRKAAAIIINTFIVHPKVSEANG